ncbi:unnamed protein product [Calicophoron daubneyi]|uniref:Cilia- and flagella-associated protein 69 ARM repeats domain-containing protein n=1 Tax=Calicophoron daubneyi TaxID=300641 RepID=A0AAV2TAZ2_CALDB
MATTITVSGDLYEKRHGINAYGCFEEKPKSDLNTKEQLCRAVKLISDPHTDFMYDRHRTLIDKILKANRYGYKLRDLISLHQLLTLCADRNATQPEQFKQHLLELINLCKYPYLKELSSDEKTYFNVCTDSLSQLGYLLRVNDRQIQLAICHALEEFYDPIERPPCIPEAWNMRHTSPEFNRQTMEQSDVTESLFLLYTTLEGFTKLRLRALKILQRLTFNSG